jgi:hypothetical protein
LVQSGPRLIGQSLLLASVRLPAEAFVCQRELVASPVVIWVRNDSWFEEMDGLDRLVMRQAAFRPKPPQDSVIRVPLQSLVQNLLRLGISSGLQ